MAKNYFFEIRRSSGLGGFGHISLITSEAKLYFIGFEESPYSKRNLGKFNSLFQKITESGAHLSHLNAEDVGFVKYPK